LKKDIAQKQEIHETKQIRDLRRELKKLEDDLIDERNQKIELAKNNETLRMIIKEKELALEKSLGNTLENDGKYNVLSSQFEDKNL
jgi:hypothetical protein